MLFFDPGSCSTVPITERRQLTIYPESVINRQAFLPTILSYKINLLTLEKRLTILRK